MSFVIKGDLIKFEGSIEELKKEISIKFSNRTVSAQKIADDHNVTIRTLYSWAHKYGTFKPMVKNYTIIQKIKLILEFEGLNPEQKGEFLRTKGLYEAELLGWKKHLQNLPDYEVESDSSVVKSIKADLLRTKNLLRQKNGELIKKERELKEANALLDLKKKVDHLFGNKDEE